MISTFTMISAYFAVLMSILVPITITIYGLIKKKLVATPFMIGALMFFVMRIVIVGAITYGLTLIPVFNDLLNNSLFAAMVVVLILAVVDVLCKYFGYKFLLKAPDSIRDVMSIALGQGVAEVLMTIAQTAFYCLTIFNAINNGSIYEAVSETLTSADISELVVQYSAIKPDLLFYYGVSALCIMALHIIVSFFVVQARNRRDKRYLLFAFVIILGGLALMYALTIYSYLSALIAILIYTLVVGYLTYSYKIYNVQDTADIISV
ncbi:hypothetical protein SDC9_69070 [bioreactor metagenome]|uniref:Membrane protein YhfC n=1 Tax=bioreactor metagenome TaxID=1076179 RepID=A0A644Y7R4_9ZZZZ